MTSGSSEVRTLEDEIIEVLQRERRAMGPKEVSEYVSGTYGTVRNLMPRMRDDGVILQRRGGEYFHHDAATDLGYDIDMSIPNGSDEVQETAQQRDAGKRDPIYSTLTNSDLDASEHIIGYVAGREAMSRPGRSIFWMHVSGDAMGETYKKNSVVPVLRFSESPEDLRSDDVYVFQLEGVVQIKRLQRLPGQRIRVISDNTKYQPYDIDLDEGVDFKILGRVLV